MARTWVLSRSSWSANIKAVIVLRAVVPADADLARTAAARSAPPGRVRLSSRAVRRSRPSGLGDPPGLPGCRAVTQERQGDVTVDAGEQVQQGRVVGRRDHPQLVLGVTLMADQPPTVTGERPRLGQRSPLPVLVPQRVGQDEPSKVSNLPGAVRWRFRAPADSFGETQKSRWPPQHCYCWASLNSYWRIVR
jgi:hypothetical protein